MKKKQIIIGSTILVLLFVLLGIWHFFLSPTKIAFMNFQVINLEEIYKANNNSFIKVTELSTDELNKLTNYDMVFINAMGMRITADQREKIKKAGEKIPILSSFATNPENRIVTIDSIQGDTIRKYLVNGGRKNYKNMLNYVRKYVDKKLIYAPTPEAVIAKANDMIYHKDPKKPDDEELGFNSIKEYNKFLQKNNLLKEDAPQIVLTGMMGEPTELIKKLEELGNVVYPVRLAKKFIENHHIDSIHPSAIINMAHGRMGDYIVNYLSQQNIPLFAPLNINRLVEDWESDKMGMSGGFLSQSVVTPEIDGSIRPYVLFGQYLDKEGMHHAFAIPERLETFVETVNHYIQLQHKPNSEKRIAIYYYKGPGQNAMTAAGMEVTPSLYNLLVRLKNNGYNVNGLPASAKELEKMIQEQGAVFGTYAEGAMDKFMKNAHPELINKEQYEGWVKKVLRPDKYAEVVATYGEFPGESMTTDNGELGIARLQFGNVVLLPQNAAAKGDNEFKVVHGVDAAPPHNYIASYLWTQFGFKADALIHFGTHGSLEFTPRKQVALSNEDWPDRLVGTIPHYYIYTISNVGEGMIAKRRSYAGLQSYLTPPFLESSVRGIYLELMEKIKIYNHLIGVKAADEVDNKGAKKEKIETDLNKASLEVKTYTVKLGIHRELELDSVMSKPYTEDEILRIENFAEELATEKITGQLYTMGVPYEDIRITSSVYAMATEPIAYSLMALDKMRHRADEQTLKHKAVFTQKYLNPAHDLVTKLLTNPALGNDEFICKVADISIEELVKAHKVEKAHNMTQNMMSGGIMNEMMTGSTKMPDSIKRKMSTAQTENKQMPSSMKKMDVNQQKGNMPIDSSKQMPDNAKSKGMERMMGDMPKKKRYTKEETDLALAIVEIDRTIKNVGNYKRLLQESPEDELASMINALNGGYTKPSPGGDPIVNPNTLPTGRNLYGINAEATPSESAWEKGKQLADNTIEIYKRRHNDSIPRKVSYTLWSGEFIETEGATIAQILYMLGVEPIRDAFGRVTDLKLIPSKELGRPRIDVVVQTSGQLRDLAASRLFLINRAVEMAANAKEDIFTNQVAEGVVESEKKLIENGLTPKDAREISTYRVFGAANGGYGTGIQGMVMSGDRWENEKEIADTYINNMGAYYGSEKNWEVFRKFAFEAALTRTDAVIQPRQSNTWGALSLDHVYEFMGGINLAVRNVTGKDPDAYLSDYRNRNNFRMQEVKEAIGVESRTTIFNPTYIKEKMKGDAGGASTFAEIIQNTYGWNVMKPKAIDKEMWDEIYNVYVKDKFNLDVQKYFEEKNPAALEEMTAVMMETIRKGMWKANDQQIADIAKLHTDLVNKYKPSCSGFVCDNAKLREFIASKTNENVASEYKKNIHDIRQATANDKKGVVMKKEELAASSDEQANNINSTIVSIAFIVVVIGLILFVKYRRRKMMK